MDPKKLHKMHLVQVATSPLGALGCGDGWDEVLPPETLTQLGAVGFLCLGYL